MLVVDDDADFLALTARLLKEMGVEVVLTARSAAEAIKEAEARRPDAALVDVGLPDGQGTDLARQLAELSWRPRVVVTSTDRDAARGSGDIAFIPKEELVDDSLRRLLLGD